MASPESVEAAIHELAPRYEGMDPFQVETIYQRMARDLYSDGGQIHMNAAAAIEIACWDIIGKETGRPIYDLLGGQYHERLPVYANGWYQGERKPEMFAEKANEVVARGYKALKFDPFGAAWRTMTQEDRRLSIEIVEAVRDAVGPDIQLMIEGHRRFSRRRGDQDRPRAGPITTRPGSRSRPTTPRSTPPHEVAAKLPIPVSAGESFTSTHQFAELLAHNTVHILQPDPSNLGGILRAQRWSAGWSMPGTAWSRRIRRRDRSRPPSASRSMPARRTCSSRSCSTSSTSTGSATSSLGTPPWPRTARSISRLVRVSAAISSSARSRSTRTRPAISCRSSRLAGRSGKASNRLSRRPTRMRSRSDDD